MLGRNLVLPARPMLGWIMVADPSLRGQPADNGGNMDNAQLAPGATIYLRAATRWRLAGAG